MRGQVWCALEVQGRAYSSGTKHGLGFLVIVRSHSWAGRLQCDSSIFSQGKAKEDEYVESLESGESRHDMLASSVKEFGNVGSTLSIHTQ